MTAAVGPAPWSALTVEVAEGLAARVLLDHAVGADLLVLGSATVRPRRHRPGGPGLPAACAGPVVVVSVAMTSLPVPA